MQDQKYNEISDIIYTIQQNSELLQSIGLSAIIIYLENKVIGGGIKNYELYKEFNKKDPITINKPIKLPNIPKLNKDKILKNEFGELVIEFIKVIQERLPHVNLSYLHTNLKTLNIMFNNFKLVNFIFNKRTQGNYTIGKNIIKLQNGKHLESIDHELFHTSSSFYDEKRDISFSGFSQTSENGGIGNGINEGYTQLLTVRYFQDIRDVSGPYILQVYIAECLEMIIGQQEMEKMYFNADLYGLVQELKKYDSEENVMKFISNVDFIHKHIDDEKLLLIERDLLQKCLINIFSFLLKCFTKKLLNKYQEGKLDRGHFKILLRYYIDVISTNLENGKKKTRYHFATKQSISEILNEVLVDTPDLYPIDNENEVSKVY